MPLYFEDGHPFAQGAASFSARAVSKREVTSRIFVSVQIGGTEAASPSISTEAVIDTGGAYLVCNPEIADLLDLDPDAALLSDERILLRGSEIGGDLYRLHLTFWADEGGSPKWEVTAFVPRPLPTQTKDGVRRAWEDIPPFIGFTGCLELMRFAVDPLDDKFYFGSINA